MASLISSRDIPTAPSLGGCCGETTPPATPIPPKPGLPLRYHPRGIYLIQGRQIFNDQSPISFNSQENIHANYISHALY